MTAPLLELLGPLVMPAFDRGHFDDLLRRLSMEYESLRETTERLVTENRRLRSKGCVASGPGGRPSVVPDAAGQGACSPYDGAAAPAGISSGLLVGGMGVSREAVLRVHSESSTGSRGVAAHRHTKSRCGRSSTLLSFEHDSPPRLTTNGSIDLRTLGPTGQRFPEPETDSSSGESVLPLPSVQEPLERNMARHPSVFGPKGMRLSTKGRVSEKPLVSSTAKLFVSWRRRSCLDTLRRHIVWGMNSPGDILSARLVVNPERSLYLQVWDRLVLAAVIYIALVTPVQVSMLPPLRGLPLYASSLVDIIFFHDMVLQFFLMIPKRNDHGYTLEKRHLAIVINYLRTWFVADFLSFIPFDAIVFSSRLNDLKTTTALTVIRLVRLLKLVSVLKSRRLLRRFEVRMPITYGTFALVKFFALLVLITHWLANLWALTLVLVDESENVPRWIDSHPEIEMGNSPWKLYLVCLYFTSYTITSVGYGDIGPQNIVETAVCTAMLVVAGIAWALVLGQVSMIVSNLNKDEQAFRTIMDELSHMMQDRVIPPEMRRRLRSFFLSNRLAQRHARHGHLIEAMSPGLQGEFVMELNGVWIAKVGFLGRIMKEAEGSSVESFFHSFIVDVSMKMECAFHAQSEVFGVSQALYILRRGLVSRHAKLNSFGAVWGVDFILSDMSLLEPADCLALTYVEVMFLRRETFLNLVEGHKRTCPGLKWRVRRVCCWLALQRALMKEAKRRVRKSARRRRRLETAEAACRCMPTRGDCRHYHGVQPVGSEVSARSEELVMSEVVSEQPGHKARRDEKERGGQVAVEWEPANWIDDQCV